MIDDDWWSHLLRSNQGFSDPERWIAYAKQHHFTRVRAGKLTRCPDCNAATWKKVGQYVYYSTLINLNTCANCGLVYSDTRIDSHVIQKHFEHAYKDEEYFLENRRVIYDQIISLVDQHAPRRGKVIDIGGAKGHLMAALSRRRPDLRLVVNDVSSSSCAWAASNFHFETICGSAADLDQLHEQFDVVTMIDVIYYEPRISELWHCLSHLVADGGAIIIRVPNKLRLILLHQFLARFMTPWRAREMSTQVKYFNPEHLFIYCRRYLTRRLGDIGFNDIVFMPSALPIRHERWRFIYALYLRLATAIHALSLGRVIITSSVLVVAGRSSSRRRGDGRGTTESHDWASHTPELPERQMGQRNVGGK